MWPFSKLKIKDRQIETLKLDLELKDQRIRRLEDALADSEGQRRTQEAELAYSNAKLELDVYNWSAHNWPRRNTYSVLASTTEELGEVARCVNKSEQGIRGTLQHWDEEMWREIGDTAISLIDLCAIKGWSFSAILRERFREVQVRDWKKFPKNGRTE